MAHRQQISCALLLTFCILFLFACGDDDPVAPPIAGQLPDLATATQASVHVRVMGVLVNRGDITLGWQDFGTAPTPGTYVDSNQVFAGAEEISATHSRDFNRVHLEFDRESGRITRLLSRKEHYNPTYSTYQSAAAHDIPLHSFAETDSTWEAVWRLEGVLVCAAIDSVDFDHNRYVDEFLTWSCAGEEEAVIEVRVWN